MNRAELEAVWSIRKAFSSLQPADVTERIISGLVSTADNAEFEAMVVKQLQSQDNR